MPSSLRRSTRLTASAISRAVGGAAEQFREDRPHLRHGDRWSFPPHPPAFQDEEPQRQERQRDVVMPAHPTADLVVGQAHLPLPLLQHFLDLVPARPRRTSSASGSSADALLKEYIQSGCGSSVRITSSRSSGPIRRFNWRTPGPRPLRPPEDLWHPRGS